MVVLLIALLAVRAFQLGFPAVADGQLRLWSLEVDESLPEAFSVVGYAFYMQVRWSAHLTGNNSLHLAVFTLPCFERRLQQCVWRQHIHWVQHCRRDGGACKESIRTPHIPLMLYTSQPYFFYFLDI